MKQTLGLIFQKILLQALSTFRILGGGAIESDFWGNICVILTNFSKREIEIETGDRIAQMSFLKPEEAEFVEVAELDKTERGNKGFGSTG